MKKIVALALSCMLLSTSIYAAEGEMGCFGGISPGIKLQTITELSQTKNNKNNKNSKASLPYKENIYLAGRADMVEGTIEISSKSEIDKEKAEGTYTDTYKMTAESSDGTIKLTRNISLETTYIYEPVRKQSTKVTTAKKWSEIITVGETSYRLDSKKSSLSKSILEDYTPGVTYYSGDIHYDAVYEDVNNEGSYVTVSVSAPIYGYEEAYAKAETQKRTITIDKGNNNGYSITETPTYTVYRDIEYTANEPTAMSMAGNYREIIRSEGALSYNILQGNIGLYDNEYSGMISVENTPTVEQLSLPTGLRLNGDPAEPQIKKMYSMKIFDDDGKNFSSNQIVTRKEYVAMLVKALRIPLPEEKSKKKSSKKDQEVVSVFTDISESDPYYKYAIAAYNAGLVEGGKFNGDMYLTRELMYVLNMKAIGLQRLGLATGDAYTPFVDDNQISSWAKESIYAASKIGLITPTNGYIFPTKRVTKAECATFLDQLVEYLRYDLQKDYNDLMFL